MVTPDHISLLQKKILQTIYQKTKATPNKAGGDPSHTEASTKEEQWFQSGSLISIPVATIISCSDPEQPTFPQTTHT